MSAGSARKTTEWLLAQTLLEALIQPLFIIDKECRCFFENTAARRVREGGKIFKLSSGRLVACDPAQRPVMGAFARQIDGCTSGTLHGPLRVWSPDQKSMILLFLAGIDLDGAIAGIGSAGLLMIHDVHQYSQVDERVLRELFALSESEARVAAMLAEGNHVATVAAALHISIATVRTHLKAIFRKTGANRQQDLMRVIERVGSVSATLENRSGRTGYK